MTSLCLAIAYVFCLVVSIFPETILRVLFGMEFMSAAPALRVHVWSNIFSILGMAQNSWILGRGLLWVALQNTIFGAAINLALNLFVIPSYGAVGASWTTLVSMAVATVGAMAIRPSTRSLAYLHLRGLALAGIAVVPGRLGGAAAISSAERKAE
jgi:PST family polysaccharide transporter